MHVDRDGVTPEQALWRAVLSQVVSDIRSSRVRLGNIISDIEDPSFDSVCDLAGFNPETVRKGFARLIARRKAMETA